MLLSYQLLHKNCNVLLPCRASRFEPVDGTHPQCVNSPTKHSMKEKGNPSQTGTLTAKLGTSCCAPPSSNMSSLSLHTKNWNISLSLTALLQSRPRALVITVTVRKKRGGEVYMRTSKCRVSKER